MIFVFLQKYGCFQVQLLCILSVTNLVILIGIRPFESPQQNRVEILNEVTIYLCSVINFVYVNVAVPIAIRSGMGYVFIGLCFVNAAMNILLMFVS